MELEVFNFGGCGVRTVTIDNQPWFVATDLAKALGCSDGRSMIRSLKSGMVKLTPIETKGGLQNLSVINEEGLIHLCLKSRNNKGKLAASLIISKLKDSMAILQALSDFEIPDDLPEMYVYAIRETESGRVKIGISRNPEARLKQLQTGNSQELELVAYRRAENSYQDEREVHKALEGFQVRGEWFNMPHSDVPQVIR